MNNLHRELAPISDAAWASIEEEAGRTFQQHVAARRVVDVQGPEGLRLASVSQNTNRIWRKSCGRPRRLRYHNCPWNQ